MCSRYSFVHRTSLMGLIARRTASTTTSAGVDSSRPSTSTGVGAAELTPSRSAPPCFMTATPTMPRSCPAMRLSFR